MATSGAAARGATAGTRSSPDVETERRAEKIIGTRRADGASPAEEGTATSGMQTLRSTTVAEAAAAAVAFVPEIRVDRGGAGRLVAAMQSGSDACVRGLGGACGVIAPLRK